MQVRQIERLLSKKQVREITALSYTQIARIMKEGKFPPGIRLTDHPRGRWLAGYLGYEWLKSRISQQPR